MDDTAQVAATKVSVAYANPFTKETYDLLSEHDRLCWKLNQRRTGAKTLNIRETASAKLTKELFLDLLQADAWAEYEYQKMFGSNEQRLQWPSKEHSQLPIEPEKIQEVFDRTLREFQALPEAA